VSVERESALRVRISAAFLLLGAAAFWTSLALPAVVKSHAAGVLHVDGWTAATHFWPTAVTNAFLALAFLVWALAHWFRRRWAWKVGVGLSIVAATFHTLIGAWPGFAGIRALHAGYWLWSVATTCVLLAFLFLPPPRRGELTRDETDRGRAGLAWTLAGAATVALVGAHFFLPTALGAEWRPGVPQEGDRFTGYAFGPVRVSHYDPAITETRLLTERSYPRLTGRYVAVRGTVVERQMGETTTALVETTLLLLPVLFLVAATTRRRAWRVAAVVAALAVAVATPLLDDPWPWSGFAPHPLQVLWWGTPTLFVVAAALLPQRRFARNTASTV
jgi:hypothetical protein